MKRKPEKHYAPTQKIKTNDSDPVKKGIKGGTSKHKRLVRQNWNLDWSEEELKSDSSE